MDNNCQMEPKPEECRQVIMLRNENQYLYEQLRQYVWVVRGMALLAVLDAALIIWRLL